MRHLSPVALCLFPLLLTTHCLAQPPATQPPATEPSPAAESSQQAGKHPAKVKLVNPGSAPRQAFRFKPQVGSQQSFVMLMNMQQKMFVGGNAMPAPVLPTQKFTIDLKVAQVSPEGDVHTDWVYRDIDILDEAETPQVVADKIRELVTPLAGMSGKVVVSNRGFTQEANFKVPENLDPQLKQLLGGMLESMDKLSAPVPQEPIGIGAVWTVTQQVVANGLSLNQVATYKLTAIDDSGYHLDVTVDQQADEQWINPPNLPATTKIKLRKLDSAGTGKMTLANDLLMPRNSDLDLKSDTAMEIVVGEQTQAMETKMTMKMAIKSFPPGETTE